MKKMFCLLLCLTLILTTFTPSVYASTGNQTSPITISSVQSMSVNELTTAARNATSDEEAQIIFDELVSRNTSVPSNNISMYASTTSIINTYLKVSSCTTSYRKIKLSYEVLAIVPSGAHLTIGYDYPEVTRTTGERINIGSSKGTFSETIETKGLICGVRVNAKISARDFSDTVSIKKYLDAPSGKKTSYHTVTTSDVVGSIILSTIGGFTLSLYFKKAKYVLAPLAQQACAKFLDTADSLNISLGIPSPQVGQYYKVVTYYKNYKAYIETTVWYNKNAYDVGADPIYEGTETVNLVKP